MSAGWSERDRGTAGRRLPWWAGRRLPFSGPGRARRVPTATHPLRSGAGVGRLARSRSACDFLVRLMTRPARRGAGSPDRLRWGHHLRPSGDLPPHGSGPGCPAPRLVRELVSRDPLGGAASSAGACRTRHDRGRRPDAGAGRDATFGPSRALLRTGPLVRSVRAVGAGPRFGLVGGASALPPGPGHRDPFGGGLRPAPPRLPLDRPTGAGPVPWRGARSQARTRFDPGGAARVSCWFVMRIGLLILT